MLPPLNIVPRPRAGRWRPGLLSTHGQAHRLSENIGPVHRVLRGVRLWSFENGARVVSQSTLPASTASEVCFWLVHSRSRQEMKAGRGINLTKGILTYTTVFV